MKVYYFILTLLISSVTFAQTKISGKVSDQFNLPLPGASVSVVGEGIGTITDVNGNFSLTTEKLPTFAISISSMGFVAQTLQVTSNNAKFEIKLEEEENKLNEVVISASRTPERILESPVTVERMGIQDIKATTAATFYDGLENLKEVHFNTSSMNFKSVNTRGFATVANTRFMQLVDGMDNSSPALNFVLGNLIGLSELDVASVELLPGASSALYGANAFNGILFMTSKSPFTHQGLSTYIKRGITSQDVAGDNQFTDLGVRAAHAFTKHFAAKANFNYMTGTEWIADDRTSMTGGFNGREGNQNYDGLNLYGDEVTTFIPNVGQVSRTGYAEKDLSDNKVKSVKADFSLHFKPFDNDFEIIAQHKLGFGNTVYQGANRYYLKDFYMDQTKLEIKGKNFFVRGYLSSEDAGDSYDMRFAGWNVNRAAKGDVAWFTDYATAYQLSSAMLGFDANTAANYARGFADNNTTAIPGFPGENPLGLTPNGQPRFEPGTKQFNQALSEVIANPDLTKGARFQDNSKIYHADANYNFKDLIGFAEFQTGGSVRRYRLNSYGTIFTDYDKPISYYEYGVYAQGQKKFLDDKLKFQASLRYDKSQNFDGQISPRISFVYTSGENRNHNFRASYQTGFRNPTTQDQYIGLDLGPFALIGSAEENLDRYVETMPVSAAGQLLGEGETVELTGRDAYQNDVYTVPSVNKFAQTKNVADLEIANINLVKPEQVKAFEVGYKAILENGLSVDLNAYYNIYNDFMSTSRVINPYYGIAGTDFTNPEVLHGLRALENGDRRVYQVYTNTSETVTSSGFGIGLSQKVYKDFELGVNYNHSQFDFDQEKDPSFIAGFNTPKHRVKASLGNTRLFKNFGFNMNVRWNSEYLWQSSFADGMIPDNTVFDAQINYAIPALKSVIKVGANNLFGKDYLQVIGAGYIGRQVFASLTINP